MLGCAALLIRRRRREYAFHKLSETHVPLDSDTDEELDLTAQQLFGKPVKNRRKSPHQRYNNNNAAGGRLQRVRDQERLFDSDETSEEEMY